MSLIPKKGNVYVVDDDEAVRDSLQWLLEGKDYRVRCFDSAESFLSRYDPREVACLIVDIRMPGITGLELQDRLLERKSPLPIVVITGHGDVPMAVNTMKKGAMDFIPKPFKEEELLKALEKTSHQAQRAGQIIQRIRSFVRRSETNRILTLIAPMVTEAVELADIELRRRQVRLSLYVSDRINKILVDPILIEQVLINLLKNAAEAIEHANRPVNERHVELQIVPKVVEQQEVVLFSVTDSGEGMPSEVMARVFEAFYTTKSEGMGIGLNLCRTIIESHQGRMHAENIYNGSVVVGCRFSFWLPANSPTITA